MTEFSKKLKVVSFDFSMMKSIVGLVFLKSFPIKLIRCGAFNIVCLLKSIAINFNFWYIKM